VLSTVACGGDPFTVADGTVPPDDVGAGAGAGAASDGVDGTSTGGSGASTGGSGASTGGSGASTGGTQCPAGPTAITLPSTAGYSFVPPGPDDSPTGCWYEGGSQTCFTCVGDCAGTADVVCETRPLDTARLNWEIYCKVSDTDPEYEIGMTTMPDYLSCAIHPQVEFREEVILIPADDGGWKMSPSIGGSIKDLNNACSGQYIKSVVGSVFSKAIETWMKSLTIPC